jgi:hypothetical protein
MEFLPPEDVERYRSGKLVIRDEGGAGSNECAAFHPDAYIRSTLAGSLAVVDHRPGTKWLSQDIYLLRKL